MATSHNNNVNLTPQMAAIANNPQRETVAVFWDYENCPCPVSVKLSNLCYDIKQRIDTFLGKKLNKRIQLYCPMERLQPRTRENANDLGVLCMDVATKRKQESVDKRIIADIGLFAAELAETNNTDIGHIVLVSGDSDFGYILARLRDKAYIGQIIMFVNDFAKDTLTQHADHSCCLFQSNLTRKDNPFSDYNQRKLPGGGGNNNKSYSMSASAYPAHSASYHNLPYMNSYHMPADGSAQQQQQQQWNAYHNYPYSYADSQQQQQHHHHRHHHDTTTPPQPQQQQQQQLKHNNGHSHSLTNLHGQPQQQQQQQQQQEEKDKTDMNGAGPYYRRKDQEAMAASSHQRPGSKKPSKKEQKRANSKKRASSKETRQQQQQQQKQNAALNKQAAQASDANESSRVVSHENLEQQLKQKQKELNEQKQSPQHKNGLCETAPTVSIASVIPKTSVSPSLSPSKLEFGQTPLHDTLPTDFFAAITPNEEDMNALMHDIVPKTDFFGSHHQSSPLKLAIAPKTSHVISLEQMRVSSSSSTAPKGLLLKKKPVKSSDENADLNSKLQKHQKQQQQQHKPELHPLVEQALQYCAQQGHSTPRRYDIFKAMQTLQADLMQDKDESFADAAIEACLRRGVVEELIPGRVAFPYLLPLIMHTLTDVNASTFYKAYQSQLEKHKGDITQLHIKLGDVATYLRTRFAQQIDRKFSMEYLHRTISNATELFHFHKEDRKKNVELLSDAQIEVLRFRVRRRLYLRRQETQS